MPKLIGKSVRVVEVDGFSIDEYVGNVGSNTDAISVAIANAATPTSEPWLTMDYEEYLVVIKGAVEIHHGEGQILKAKAGETIHIQKGERFRPFFTEPGTKYLPICMPAFKPERCRREDDDTTVADKLQELHGSKDAAATSTESPNPDTLYHMCQKSLWEESVKSGIAYFPPTFEVDGGFTHATAVSARLLRTANHFYTHTTGDWICLELSVTKLRNAGIITKFEEPKPVGSQEVSGEWQKWVCPHIFGGIPAIGIVDKTYSMKRNDDGTFEAIEGLTN